MNKHTVVMAGLAFVLTGTLAGLAFHGEEGHSEDAVTIKFAECPQAVQKTLAREARGAKIEEVDLGTVDLLVAFTAHATIDGKTYLIHVNAAGQLVSKTLDEDETAAEKIALAACPPAVQKTLTREADGAKIATVRKVAQEGRTLFETSVTLGDDTYDLSVTAEGLLLSKEVPTGIETETEGG